MKARRGHMVSRGYLSAWADKRNTVDVLDLQGGRGYPSSIMNASVVSYVYDPEVLTQNLEDEYARIESRGISAITKLRTGKDVTVQDQDAVVAFLDMHLHRGRYADRANVRVPAVLMMKDGSAKEAELSLGDMLLLTQEPPDILRLSTRGLSDWPWRIYEVENLSTGDGAVLLWRPTADDDLTTVTFPLSPTQLLVIGDELPERHFESVNLYLAKNCRRWMVSERGSLNLAGAPEFVAQRATERNDDGGN